MRARILGALALTLLAAPVQAATYYASPTGSASFAASTNPGTPASLATMHTVGNLQPGDVVQLQDGTYPTGIDPNFAGTAANRIRWIGNTANPSAVTLPSVKLGADLAQGPGQGFANGRGDYMTVQAVRVTGSIKSKTWFNNSTFVATIGDSLVDIVMAGTFVELSTRNGVAVVRMTGSISGSLTVAGQSSNCQASIGFFARNTSFVDCNLSIGGIFDLDASKFCTFTRSRFNVTTTGNVARQPVSMYNTQLHTWTDCRIEVTNNSTNSESKTTIDMRDSTGSMTWVRDTIRTLPGTGAAAGHNLYLTNSGCSNSPIYTGQFASSYTDCLFDLNHKSTEDGMLAFQDRGVGDTFTNCVFISRRTGFPVVGFYTGTNSAATLNTSFDHCTFVSNNPRVVEAQNSLSPATGFFTGCVFVSTVVVSGVDVQLRADAPGPTFDRNLFWSAGGDSGSALRIGGVTLSPTAASAGKWRSPMFMDSSMTPAAFDKPNVRPRQSSSWAVGSFWPSGYAGAFADSLGSPPAAQPGITVTPTDGLFTNEAGDLNPTFSVVLDAAPTASVVIPITSGDTSEGTVDKSSLTFTTGNWNTPQVVTITGVDDAIVDGDITYFIETGLCVSADGAYQGLNPSDVRVVNRDDDESCTPSLLISQASSTTTEAGGSATFTVALSCEPTDDVFLSVSSLDEGEGVVTGISGGDDTFDAGDYATPRTLTITGIDDDIDDGDIPYLVSVRLVSFGDHAYDGMEQRLNFTNTDNDAAGVNVFPVVGLVTTEAGAQATFNVRLLSQPTANVTIALSSSDLTEGTVSPSSLTFTSGNWSSNQTVTVTGVDDLAADGDIAYTILTGQCVSTDPNYAAIDPSNVSVSNADNDVAAITVSPVAGLVTTEAGGQATFSIVLATQPTASVSIGLSTSDATEGTVSPASVTFTTSNWATPQTVTVTGQDDGLTDGDVAYTIVTAAATSGDGDYNGLNPSDVSVTNTDNEAAAPVASSFTYAVQSTGRTVPINRRVAVVWDSRWAAFGGTTGPGSLNNMDRSLGNFFEMLERQGCVLHHYESDWFERTDGNGGLQRNLAIWQTLGSNYGLAVMPYWSASGASSRKTYFSADSTTVPLLHIGGAGNSGYLSWADSSFGLVERQMDALGSTAFFGLAQGSVRPYAAASTDTMWIVKGGIGTRCAVLPAGVTSVTRLFEPLRLAGAGNVSFSAGLDSLYSTFPTPGNATAGANEWMPLAWRVNWSSGRSVDYLKMASNSAYGTGNVGPIAIALAARHLDLQPVKFALEWDDITDLNSSSGLRPTNAAMDSLYQEFRNVWGVPVTVDVNPRNASSYIRGVTPDYETAVPWSGSGWEWMRKHRATWIHHAHDSTSSHPSANLLGRYGGYNPGNGSGDSSGAFGSRHKYAHRYASRYDPNNASSSQRYGILQRLAYSDSVRRSVCPECVVPPYLSFPNNEALPMSWRSRPLTANPSWKVYAGDGGTPVDSLMWALHYGLNVPQGTELYLRATFTTSTGAPAVVLWRPWGDRSTLNMHFGADHDSLPANSPFTFPDERWTGTVRGRFISARNVATVAYDGGTFANYTGNSGPVLATIFGTRNPVQTGGGISYLWNESFTLNPSGIYAANNTEMRNIGSRQRTRVIYFHPGSFRHANGPLGSYAADVFRIGILRPIRALESIAGQQLIRWVRPWEVY